MPAIITDCMRGAVVIVLSTACWAQAQQWTAPGDGPQEMPQSRAMTAGVNPAIQAFLKPIDAPSALDGYRRLHETRARVKADARAEFRAASPAVIQQASQATQVVPAQYASQVQQIADPPSLATPPLADGYPGDRPAGGAPVADRGGEFTIPSREVAGALPQNGAGQGSAVGRGAANFQAPAAMAAAQPTAPAAGLATNPWSEGSVATASNSPFVTAPVEFASAYSVDDPCAPVAGVPYAAPATVAPPVITPDMAPPLYAGAGVGYHPLFTLGQSSSVVLGRGIIGQPVAYVPGQTFRNFLRYISP